MHRQESIFDIIIDNTSIIFLYLHRHHIHRFLYPEVIIISYHGNSPSIIITRACLLSLHGLTLAQVFLLTN